MKEIFYPTSIAVIGVSPKPTNLGRNIVANLVEYGFDGVVYAVGPSGGMIETRRIYKTIAEIPDKVDLAVIFTPAKTVPSVLEECGKKGIKWVIIETAGFREFTAEGQQLEEEMCRIANQYGIRFVGPNCIGVINMENGMCVPFPRMEQFVKQGNVSIITQSGGVGMSVLNLMANEGLGLNKFVSVGNMLNIDAEDVLEYLIEDEGTELIFVYLESMRDGRKLMEAARKSTKPILLFKSNIGRLGENIAMSHTASLASDDKVVEAALVQAGVVRIKDATTLGNSLKILELPPMKGKNLAIISRSGGHAVIAADACELSGFELAHFPEKYLREIEKHFRASVIRLTNPLDLGDLFDLDVYAQIIEQTLQLKDVDGVIFLHTSLSDAENATSRLLLEKIMSMTKKYDKPVAYYLSAAAREVSDLKQTYNFPIFTQVVETIRALESSYAQYLMATEINRTLVKEKLETNPAAVREILDAALKDDRDLLLSEALDVLEAYGIPTIKSRVAHTVEEVQLVAEEIGYPVAIKVISQQISHKSDVGGVQLNLMNGPAVAVAFEEMISRTGAAYPDVQIDGVLVQPMVTGGREIIIGGKHDPQFGPVILVGLGGIFVEVFEESVIRVAPVDRAEVKKMISELKGVQILQGARGSKPFDLEAVEDALMRLSQLMVDFPEISELDVNPLRVFYRGSGCRSLDARISLSNPG
jgi:acyl-CoA synthetase (NDP forming)